jgi:hypothetical protein
MFDARNAIPQGRQQAHAKQAALVVLLPARRYINVAIAIGGSSSAR